MVKCECRIKTWKLSSFGKEEIDYCQRTEENTEICLREIAEEKAEDISEKEGWDGFAQLEPEHDAPYGKTIFYKEDFYLF